MSGMAGVVSTKIVLTAGALLFAARIGMHPVSATADPSLARTEVGPALARELRLDGSDGEKARVLAMDHATLRLRSVSVADGGAAPLTLGADVLKRVALSLDLRSRRLRLMEPAELRRVAARMTPLAGSFTGDGCFTLAATTPDGRPVQVALTGEAPRPDAASPATTVQLGPASVAASPLPPGARCPAAMLAIGLQAFAGQRIVIDLGHDRIWLG